MGRCGIGLTWSGRGNGEAAVGPGPWFIEKAVRKLGRRKLVRIWPLERLS
jgi:hypothetical protein